MAGGSGLGRSIELPGLRSRSNLKLREQQPATRALINETKCQDQKLLLLRCDEAMNAQDERKVRTRTRARLGCRRMKGCLCCCSSGSRGAADESARLHECDEISQIHARHGLSADAPRSALIRLHQHRLQVLQAEILLDGRRGRHQIAHALTQDTSKADTNRQTGVRNHQRDGRAQQLEGTGQWRCELTRNPFFSWSHALKKSSISSAVNSAFR